VATNNDNLGVVLDGWIDALRHNDLEAMKRHLHPDVVWQGVHADLGCPDRDRVLESIRAAGGRLPEVDAIELSAHGDQVLFGVRSPDLADVAGEPLDGAIYNVFTIAGGLIVRMQDFKTREQAVEALRARRELGRSSAGTASAQTPGATTPAPARRVQERSMDDRDDAPSGMPPDAEEAPPMGVPADAADDDDAKTELPGIPDEDSPPSTG